MMCAIAIDDNKIARAISSNTRHTWRRHHQLLPVPICHRKSPFFAKSENLRRDPTRNASQHFSHFPRSVQRELEIFWNKKCILIINSGKNNIMLVKFDLGIRRRRRLIFNQRRRRQRGKEARDAFKAVRTDHLRLIS